MNDRQQWLKFRRGATALIGLVTLLAVLTISQPRKSRSANTVDMALLLALDVSASVDASEYELMRDGLAKALTSPKVARALTNGPNRAIAVAVFQWSGFREQEIKITWRRIENENDLKALAERVRNMKRRYRGGATDIGGAIKFARAQMKKLPFAAPRRVIDIAGDGPNNVNETPNHERDITVKQGITINGLAVVGDAAQLIDYYALLVIGGPGAFVENARDFDSFATAMERKLTREISGSLLF